MVVDSLQSLSNMIVSYGSRHPLTLSLYTEGASGTVRDVVSSERSQAGYVEAIGLRFLQCQTNSLVDKGHSLVLASLDN